MYPKRLTAITISALMLLQTLVLPVAAQTPFRGVVVRLPASAERYVERTLDPGSSYTGSFIIQHEYQDKTKQVKLYIYASDFIYDNNNETVSYPNDSLVLGGSYSMSKWISFDRTEVTLDHYGQEETVNFTVKVPEAATSGARYANIIISNTPFLDAAGREDVLKDATGSAIVTRLVVSTLLMTVSGDKQQSVYLENPELVDAKGNPGLFGNVFEFHPVSIRFKLRNMGNQVLLPGGDVFIYDNDISNPVYKVELNPEHERVLPNSQHTFITTWSDSAFTIDANSGFVAIDIEHILNLHWGHYYAQVNMLYRDTSGKLSVIPLNLDFWVLPWKVPAVILVLVLVIVLYTYHRRRTGVKYISKREQEAMFNSKSHVFSRIGKSIHKYLKTISLSKPRQKRPK